MTTTFTFSASALLLDGVRRDVERYAHSGLPTSNQSWLVTFGLLFGIILFGGFYLYSALKDNRSNKRK